MNRHSLAWLHACRAKTGSTGRSALSVFGVCLLLSACGPVKQLSVGEALPPLSGAAASFVESGPHSVAVHSGSFLGEFDCTLSYEIYRPADRKSEVMVILAHGFMREQRNMRGWAAHWASHGVPVTVMSLCNSSWLSGRHERNAADLLALAQTIHDGPILYAGFSAGGLAAFLAAAADPRTKAYLGLDSVEYDGLAASAAGTFRRPALFLVAEPSACNADNNLLRAATAKERRTTLRIRNSTHCHFENPYDSRCSWVCGAVQPAEASAALLATVRSLATAWVLQQALQDPRASNVLGSALNASSSWQNQVEVVD